MECEKHSGMHINAEDLLVEIVDDDGNPLPAGRRGRLLVTNLNEYGMPLIRYDTDDESAFKDHLCSCGRHLPLIEGVVGKTGNVIYTPSGKRLSLSPDPWLIRPGPDGYPTVPVRARGFGPGIGPHSPRFKHPGGRNRLLAIPCGDTFRPGTGGGRSHPRRSRGCGATDAGWQTPVPHIQNSLARKVGPHAARNPLQRALPARFKRRIIRPR